MTDQSTRNASAFKQMEAMLTKEHLGRVALLHDGALVEIYNDPGDAYSVGCEKFGLGNFSTQQIGALPRSLGSAAAIALSVQEKEAQNGDIYGRGSK